MAPSTFTVWVGCRCNSLTQTTTHECSTRAFVGAKSPAARLGRFDLHTTRHHSRRQHQYLLLPIVERWIVENDILLPDTHV